MAYVRRLAILALLQFCVSNAFGQTLTGDAVAPNTGGGWGTTFTAHYSEPYRDCRRASYVSQATAACS